MRKIALIVAFLATVPALAGQSVTVEAVCFTPGQNCTQLIVDQIRAAKREILVQAYGFTSPEILKALLDAKKRGVDVRAILDKSNACKDDGKTCEKKGAIAADTLRTVKVPVLIDPISGIAHNKVLIIDREKVLTGSFNFTRSAQERNAENLLVLKDTSLARQYAENWERRAEVSAGN